MLDSIGTIRTGKIVDLVLLDANPLENIRNTKRLQAVVVNGRYLAKEELQKILAGVEAAAQKKRSSIVRREPRKLFDDKLQARAFAQQS